jgi:chromosome segregation ATPase
MVELYTLHQEVGALRADMEQAKKDRQETRSDIKTLINLVQPLSQRMADIVEANEDYDQRLRSLERSREETRQRIRLAKRVSGWVVAVFGAGLGTYILRKIGIDVPDAN